MRTSKTMKLVNKFIACLLVVAMLLGFASPMSNVQAATALTALDVTQRYKDGYDGGWGGNGLSSVMLEFQTKEPIGLSDTCWGNMTAVSGSGELKYNDLDVTGTVTFRLIDCTNGIFNIFGLENTTYEMPEDSDVISVKGQFTLADGSTVVEFPATTFQYMGVNANNLGYWRIYEDTVDSGSLNLDSRSLNGEVNYGWGCAIFLSSNGYAPAPTGKRALVSDGGTITKTDSATGEITDVTSTAVINSGYTDKSKAYFLENIAPRVGDIFTVKGKFITSDRFSINFKQTSFQYMGEHPDTGWGYWAPYVEVIDCGFIKPINDGAITSDALRFDVSNEDVIFGTGKTHKLRAYNGLGTILKDGAVQTNPGAVDFVYDGNGNCAIWVTWGMPLGTEVTVEGQFSLSNDSTKVINFPKTVFKVVRGNDAETLIWVVEQTAGVSSEDYRESGAVSISSTSSSSMYAEEFQIYFNTEDISLPTGGVAPYNYLLAEPGESYITYKNPNQEELDLTYRNNILYSQANGNYYIYFAHVSKPVDGTLVSIQGKFALPDGSMGIDIQPITFMYVAGETDKDDYWVTVGTNFTSDVYWEAENAYEEEILGFEATVRLPQNAKETGGVILGTNRDGEDTYAFGVDAAGAPYLALKDGNTTVEYKFEDIDVRTGNWVTMRIVRDNTTVYYYEGDELKGTLENQTAVSVVPTAKATAGGDYTANNENYFKGTLRDVKLYSDVECTQTIAFYDMSAVASTTKMLDDGNAEKAYEITRTLRWLDPEEVSVPTDYAYAFAVVGDTQVINDKNSNSHELESIYDYIVAQNPNFVFGLGDITENNDVTEWEHAQAHIQRLDEAGIPYSLVRGNHEGIQQGEDSSLMNQYFPYENYKNKWNVYYDGKIENSCQKLTVGSVDYLIFALDYNPSKAVMDWAGSIIETHPNYNVIITTHSYLYANKEYTLEGSSVWNNLAKKYSNVVLVLCGHVSANDIAWNQVKGDNGNLVTQMVINPQVADKMTSGGTGMVAMLYFSEDGKNVEVRYYSTIRNQYLADTNQFSLDLNVVKHVDAVTVKPYTNVKTTYRSTAVYKYPTLEGYLFAGWFTDEDCTKALAKNAVVDDTTTYYAKFVDVNVMTVKRQNRNNNEDLRLVTSIDSLLYECVGFKVGLNGGELKTLPPIYTVYSSLFASGATYRPEIMSAASEYFATITISGFPADLISGNVNVEVQPYWVTLDGTTVEGTSITKQLIPTE